ncbi:MAG TPA: glycosyltransferase family 39 protein [Syntrophomonadaceae bacterium]|nr:glycosyltransferase family 39 protein [Syntrophomonadaceae bacterium]
MKKNRLGILRLILICLLELIIITPVKAQTALKENSLSPTGTYDVNVISHPHYEYSTKIGIEDLGNGKIKVTGNFDGIPLSAIGYQTGKAVKTRSVYNFKISLPKLFNGSASMALQYQNNNYKLSAHGKGTYNYQGTPGHGSARITGHRVSSSLPVFGLAILPAFFNSIFNVHPLLGGLGLIGLLIIACLWLRHYIKQFNFKYVSNSLQASLFTIRNVFQSRLKKGLKIQRPLPWFNIITGLVLFIAALAVRLPWLWLVPRYIDELHEVTLGYNIYLGNTFALHNVAHDIGSMHNYILAAIFKLLGPGIYWPRLYVAVTAALTVVLIYFVGKKLYDRWTGLLAAGFLLTNGMHILVTHKAWANCTTPFFFTLAMLAIINAEQKKSGKWLVLAGLLWAAALQTHSSVVIYLLATGIYVLSKRFRQNSEIKSGWYIGAMLAFAVGYGNMIFYNLISGGGSIKWLANKHYALQSHPGIQSFIGNLLQMVVEILRTVSSAYGVEKHIFNYLLHPAFLLSLILIIMGGYWTIKRGQHLLIWMLLAGLAVMPWINHRYDFYLATRYIMPLVLCAILLMSYGINSLLKLLIPRVQNQNLLTISAGVLLIILICGQLVIFYQYCNRTMPTNLSNRTAMQVMSIIQKDYSSKSSIILVDDNLPINNKPLPDLLTISDINYVVIHKTKDVNSQWVQTFKRYKNKNIIAVISQSDYQAIKDYLTGAKTYSFYSKVLIPKAVPVPQVIYVIELKNGQSY